MNTLNIGCSYQYLENAVNIDINPEVNPDKVVDLEKKLPFKDNEFDEIIGTEVIEHIKNTHGLMKELRRILKPNGEIILTVPFHAWFKNVITALVPKYWDFHYNPNGDHVRFFSEQSFRYIFRHNGFKVTKFLYSGKYKFLSETMTIHAINNKRKLNENKSKTRN